MPRTKTRKKSKTNSALLKIPLRDYHRLNGKTIRQLIYSHRLAAEFSDRTNKEVRGASKTELANFCQQIHEEQQC